MSAGQVDHAAPRRTRWVTSADIVDVFVYTVVLGLFDEYFPQVISESFGLILLTAVVLKVMLEVIVWAKKRLVGRVNSGPAGSKAMGMVMLAVLMPASKFLVLEGTAFVFSGRVVLGGFWSVTLLVFALLAARAGVRRLL